MQRKIKFRGKRVDNGEWVYGSYHYSADNKYHYILNLEKFNERPHPNGVKSMDEMCLFKSEVNHVDPATVGQFTGLTDKNGKEIYEGDILSTKWRVEVYQDEEGAYMVRFHLNHFANKPRSLKIYLYERDRAGTSDMDNEVIGNIYENPELCKG